MNTKNNKGSYFLWGILILMLLVGILRIIYVTKDEKGVYEAEDTAPPVEETITYEITTEVVTNYLNEGDKEHYIKEQKELTNSFIQTLNYSPKFKISTNNAEYIIYSNSFTPFTEDAEGNFFFYKFLDDSELTIYLQDKNNIVSLDIIQENYNDKVFCEENNITVFSKEIFNDVIFYTLSYSHTERPNVIEVWMQNEVSVLNIYYVTYEDYLTEEMIQSVKNFVSYIKDETPKG